MVIQARDDKSLVKKRCYGPSNKAFFKTKKARTTQRQNPYKPPLESRLKNEEILLRNKIPNVQPQQATSVSQQQHVIANAYIPQQTLAAQTQQQLQATAYSTYAQPPQQFTANTPAVPVYQQQQQLQTLFVSNTQFQPTVYPSPQQFTANAPYYGFPVYQGYFWPNPISYLPTNTYNVNYNQ